MRMANQLTPVIFEDLGLVDYQQAWDYQEKRFQEVVQQKVRNRDLPEPEQKTTVSRLLFCEHPPVITLGKSGSSDNLLLNEGLLHSKGISFYKINRGGDITFHGPGQIVGYPILDLDHFFTDIHKFMRLLEEWLSAHWQNIIYGETVLPVLRGYGWMFVILRKHGRYVLWEYVVAAG